MKSSLVLRISKDHVTYNLNPQFESELQIFHVPESAFHCFHSVIEM